jgi:hypothetical protein
MISGGEKPKPRYQAHKLKGLMLATWVMFSIGRWQTDGRNIKIVAQTSILFFKSQEDHSLAT